VAYFAVEYVSSVSATGNGVRLKLHAINVNRPSLFFSLIVCGSLLLKSVTACDNLHHLGPSRVFFVFYKIINEICFQTVPKENGYNNASSDNEIIFVF